MPVSCIAVLACTRRLSSSRPALLLLLLPPRLEVLGEAPRTLHDLRDVASVFQQKAFYGHFFMTLVSICTLFFTTASTPGTCADYEDAAYAAHTIAPVSDSAGEDIFSYQGALHGRKSNFTLDCILF